MPCFCFRLLCYLLAMVIECGCGVKEERWKLGWKQSIFLLMSPKLKEILQQIDSWPEEDQEELADVAREIEARRTGIYRLSDEERAAVRAGMEAARRGDFVPDDEMEEFYRMHRTA